MVNAKYVWTFTFIDQDNSDEDIDYYPCWKCWNSLGDMEVHIRETFQVDAISHLKRDLTEVESTYANDQIDEFITNGVSRDSENYTQIELYDKHNQSAEKVYELRIWSLMVL